MRATGIAKRIDDLVRVVIPKEIRLHGERVWQILFIKKHEKT
jgi:bifunctional DNA-binding transcriptional regulator/antitoxin component of YhaV-PrlF toxin-antitoxin module